LSSLSALSEKPVCFSAKDLNSLKAANIRTQRMPAI
jgi:hypothetical protein